MHRMSCMGGLVVHIGMLVHHAHRQPSVEEFSHQLQSHMNVRAHLLDSSGRLRVSRRPCLSFTPSVDFLRRTGYHSRCGNLMHLAAGHVCGFQTSIVLVHIDMLGK